MQPNNVALLSDILLTAIWCQQQNTSQCTTCSVHLFHVIQSISHLFNRFNTAALGVCGGVCGLYSLLLWAGELWKRSASQGTVGPAGGLHTRSQTSDSAPIWSRSPAEGVVTFKHAFIFTLTNQPVWSCKSRTCKEWTCLLPGVCVV